MRKLNFISSCCLVMLLLFTACGGRENKTTTANYEVIPLPQSIETQAGESFNLGQATSIVYPTGNDDIKRVANFLAEYLTYSTDLKLTVTDDAKTENAIILKAELNNENKEAYNFTVNDKQVVINGASAAGTFYGVQTLRKSIDVDSKGTVLLPPVNISDYPRFEYRGMMLDVSRHFFPVEFIKEYIDILALHNVNKFHWHLSEDQGWRIEIKKYPKLTEIGSQRKETVIGRNTEQYDGKPYGGFYTQEQAKEIVAYAKDRFITVIPEIDLPGHMGAALAAYPELGCTGGPYEVATKWGVFDEVLCLGKDNTMKFLEDVFTELIEIFPSEYIHIGGDECPKVRWKTCPNCQARIKSLGLKEDKEHTSEEKLQSYCISYVEKFLNSKGRQIIGWDEILEGGLAPNATVMSWRSMDGGVQAAKQKNKAIMTPASHLYFDYYQTLSIENAPLAFGGYIPIERVYDFEPVPGSLTEEEGKYIIGTQANMWTEYMPAPENVEHMLMPRIDALAEVQWTMPAKKNYDSFLKRLLSMIRYYNTKGYNYSKAVFDVKVDVTPNTEKEIVEIKVSTFDNAPVYYTLDGTEPTEQSEKYTKPIEISKPVTFKTTAIRPDVKGFVYSQTFNFTKSTMKAITLKKDPKGFYAYGGAKSLVDGINGGNSYKDGNWIGFDQEEPIEALIDLKNPETISSVKVGSYLNVGDWIFGVTNITVSISNDNKKFDQVVKNNFFEAAQTQQAGRKNIEVKFEPKEARYVKVLIGKTRKIPDWHAGKGHTPYVFIDEIAID